MTPADAFDQVLREWLTVSASQTMPAALHSGAMERARRSRQRSSWSAALQETLPGHAIRTLRLARAVRVGALVAATVLIGVLIAGGLGRRPPSPSESPTPSSTLGPSATATPTMAPVRTSAFARPFSYVPPADNSIRPIAPTELLFEFIDLSASGRHGIRVVAVDVAVVHPCTGDSSRVPVRTAPANLLEDLVSIGGFTLSTPIETTVDGRAALATGRTADANACGPDLHLDNAGVGSQLIPMTQASSMLVFQVDERTVLIDIWAIDGAELDAWLPTATEFVDTIHFGGRLTGTAIEFVRPFSYVVPSGGSPLWVSREADLYGFVASPPEVVDGDSRYGPEQATSVRGIVLASVDALWIPTCGGLESDRVEVRNSAAEFLEDLKVTGGLELGPITSTVVDGLPALTTATSTSACRPELKFGSAGGPEERYITTQPPSQLFVFEVQGKTILLDVWAVSEEALESWMPTAMEFVNNIHFTSEP